MLIFLAGVALLVILIIAGERAGEHVRRAGPDRFFDHCAVCDVRYPRPAAVARDVCPRGHVLEPAVAPRSSSGAGNAVMALCAGFILVAVVLTLLGVVAPP